jgi:hypothetical protein
MLQAGRQAGILLYVLLVYYSAAVMTYPIMGTVFLPPPPPN